jgi:hypothetical protein
VGDLIESAEDLLVVDGALDERDKRANAQGRCFGIRLLRDRAIRPSEFLKLVIARRDKADLPDKHTCGTGCGARLCADPLTEDR